MCVLILTLAIFGLVTTGFATTSIARGAYWDFTGWLPTSGGSYIYVKFTSQPYYPNVQGIRMSWTQYSHYMRFLKIYGDGHWESHDVHGADPAECGNEPSYPPFDCFDYVETQNGSQKFGCYNPPGLSTVWVNCRATNPVP